jgi:hypothetical protein
MTIEQISNLYNAKPFKQFIIHLADGRSIPVLSPEFMHRAPSGRTIYVSQPGDSFHIVDLLLVTDLEIKGGGPPTAGNGEAGVATVQ